MSTKDDKPARDVEAANPEDTEDPSVVVTADDTSVGTAEAAAGSSGKRVGRKHCGALALVFVSVVVLVVVLFVACPSNEDHFVATLELSDEPYSHGRGQDPSNCKNKTGIQDYNNEALAAELPTTLPFPDATPVKAFGADVVKGYSSVQELETDLTVAAQHMLNGIILRNAYDEFYYSQNVWQSERPHARPATPPVQEVAQEVAVPIAAAVASSTASKTNNQEFDAQESDHVQNDENYVYASFGDHLVVWDHHGNQIAQVQMPAGEGGGDPAGQDILVSHLDQLGWAPSASITGLVLTPTRVVVMIDAFATFEGEFLSQSQGTQVRIYSKPTATKKEITLIETHNLNGSFRDGRWLPKSQSLHLVTSGDSNVYPHLQAPLERQQFSSTLSSQEYVNAATDLATTTLIPKFVQGLVQTLMVDGKLPNLLQVNAWSKQDLQVRSVDETMKGRNLLFSVDGPLRSFLQVVSFNPEERVETETSTTNALISSVILAPTPAVMFYATANSLVLALANSPYNETSLQAEEELFLVHLKASDGSFQSVATLPGHINSPYSLDVQGDDLRVATTVQKWRPMDRLWELCGDRDNYLSSNNDCMTESAWDQCFQLAIDGCQVINTEKASCPYEYSCADREFGQDLSSTENQVIVFDISTVGEMKEIGRVPIGEPHEVITAVRFGETFSYAMTFDHRDPFYVLKLEAGQAPEVSGWFKLDGFCRYLHPLNADATLLVGIGQNTSGTGLNQVSSGVLISVFDVSDPKAPIAVASHMLEAADSTDPVDSFTEAEWDAKAVQYANGRLVLPVSMYRTPWNEVGDDEVWFQGEGDATFDDFVDAEEEQEVAASRTIGQGKKEDFEGFVVLTVGDTGIEEAFRINFLSPEPTCHYCSGNILTSRSILFDDGSLMTMRGESVQSNNISNGQVLWTMNVTLDGVSKDCCW